MTANWSSATWINTPASNCWAERSAGHAAAPTPTADQPADAAPGHPTMVCRTAQPRVFAGSFGGWAVGPALREARGMTVSRRIMRSPLQESAQG